MKLKDLGEFGWIRRTARRVSKTHDDIIKGIGDDCAVFKSQRNRFTLVTTDTLVEGIHFLKSTTGPHCLGRKSVNVNISDIAAMGGIPHFFFLSLAIPPEMEISYLDTFTDGLLEAAEEHGLVLTGGDTTSSKHDFMITVTVIGDVPSVNCKFRNGARPGDIIQVSGPLGSSAAGLAVLSRPHDSSRYRNVIQAHIDPPARLSVGRTLGSINAVTAMIDISDGLLSDVGHICENSGVGASIRVESIPVHPETIMLARHLNLNHFDWIVSGGEDYELCWTVRPAYEEKALAKAKEAGAPDPRSIGFITNDTDITVTLNGVELDFDSTGWDHFRKN